MSGWKDSLLRPSLDVVPDDDLGRYLGLFGWIPWLLYLFAIVQIVYIPFAVIGVSDLNAWEIVALVALPAVLSLVVVPAATPLPLWRSWTLLAVVVFALVAVTLPNLSANEFAANYGWVLNPSDLIFMLLIIRGRFLLGWFGELIMQGIFATWSITVTGAPWAGLAVSFTQIIPLVAVTLFASALHRTVTRINDHRAVERERAEREAGTRAAGRSMEAGLLEVRELAGPALAAIASGSGPSTDEVRGIEAALRDLIRGRSLVREPLTQQLRMSRRNGMDILLLDDSGDDEIPAEAADALVQWVAHRLQCAEGQRMTVRLTTDGSTALVTVTLDGVFFGKMSVDVSPITGDSVPDLPKTEDSQISLDT